MKKQRRYRLYAIALLALMPLCASVAQRTTLDEVWQRVRAHYPLEAQQVLVQEMGASARSALLHAYLPRLALTGRASYQSAVPTIELKPKSGKSPFSIPGISLPQINIVDMIELPQIPRDQYQILLEGTQLIWDGGQVAAGRRRAAAETEQQTRRIEVKMHALRERINEIYFGILMIDKQIEAQQILLDEVDRQLTKVELSVTEGVATTDDHDRVRLEQVKARQQQEALRQQRKMLLTVLGSYMGEVLPEDFEAVAPKEPQIHRGARLRPEYGLINAQRLLTDTEWKSYTSKLMPTLALFARAGYGRPGLNMFDPEWAPMFIIGLQLNWSFGRLYDYGAEQRRRDHAHSLADLEQRTLDIEMSTLDKKKQGELDQIQALIRGDREVTELQRQRAMRAEEALSNGTISHYDYLQRRSEYAGARLQEEVRRLQYLKALYEMKYIYE